MKYYIFQAIALVIIIVLAIVFTKLIVESDMPVWLKFLLLK